jgi:hypothetical protein
MKIFGTKIVKAAVIFLLTLKSLGIFAQSTVTLDPACQNCPPTATLNGNAATPVPAPIPSCGTVAGTYKVGTALAAANTITLSLNVTTVGAYSITTTATNGMTFTGAGTFAGTGAQSVVLTGSGTPLNSGTTAILVQYGGTTCATAITVASNAPTAAAPIAGAVNGGSVSGKTCFDVAISNNSTVGCALLTSRTPQKADFSAAATNQQVYTFTPRGTVSNVRFSYVNTNGSVITAITGGNTGNNITTAVTATASFNTALNGSATGLTNANALTADIYVTYNDGATNNGTDRQIKITPNVKDCACCGANSYVSATSVVWLEFMCHNLDADQSLNPFAFDPDLVGGYFQWGRQMDGHQKLQNRVVLPPFNKAHTLVPNTSERYQEMDDLVAGGTRDWTTATGLRWGQTSTITSTTALTSYPMNVAKGPNDPCPAGWKVPTIRQYNSLLQGVNQLNIVQGSGTNNAVTVDGAKGIKIGNLLYLPTTGFLDLAQNIMNLTDMSYGHYYTTDNFAVNKGVYFKFGAIDATGATNRIFPIPVGFDFVTSVPVRCVIDK